MTSAFRIVRSVVPAALVISTLGCEGEPLVEGQAQAAQVEESPGFFADNLPVELQAELVPGPGSRLHLDAGGKRVFFPMPRGVRKFASPEELGAFAKKHLNASVELGKSGWILRGHSTSHGEAAWLEEETQLLHVVTDPTMALLGGVSGKIIVGEIAYCMDGRKACDEGLAAYLLPLADKTATNHVDRCSDDARYCAHYHSFFNKVDLCLFKYARHGGNTRTTRNEGQPGSLRLRGLRLCEEGDPGAVDIGRLAGHDHSTWVCMQLGWQADQPPEARTIEVDGPTIGSPGWPSTTVPGPGPTEEGFTESAVWAATSSAFWEGCAPESVEISASFVCNDHSAEGAGGWGTGDGPNRAQCAPDWEY